MSIHSAPTSRIDNGAHTHGQPDKYVSMRDLFRILVRRRMTILLTVVVITALSGIVGLLIVPRYTAQVEIMINLRPSRVVNMQSVLEDLPNDVTTIETQVKLIKSRHFAERLADELDLPLDFASRHAPSPAESWLESAWNAALGFAQEWMPEKGVASVGALGQPVSVSTPTPLGVRRDAVVESLLDNMRVNVDGTLISIGFTAADPHTAARIANAYAAEYVDDQLGDKMSATEQAADWLGGRIGELREELTRSEKAIEAFRATHDLLDLGGTSDTARRVADITGQLTTIQAERGAKEARLQTLQELRRRGDTDAHAVEMLSSSVIGALREQDLRLADELAQRRSEFGDRHPEIVRLTAERANVARSLRREMDNVVGGLQREVDQLRAREQESQVRLDKAQASAVMAKQAGVQLRDLEREAEANRALYASFLARFKETSEQKNLIRPDARVIAPASVPTVPSFPRVPLMLAGGFVTSLLLGTLLAFLAEQLDGKLRSAHQIERLLGIRNIGVVPSLGRLVRRPGKLQQYLHEKPLSVYAEAVREVEAALKLACGSPPSSVILVTSSLPSEGKTTFALSLATAAACSGLRTALVDLDFRNPSVHRHLIRTPGPDLIDYMAGSCTFDQMVQVDDRLANLHFLPVKRRAANPVRIIGSPSLAVLISLLRGRYDWVVLDTPPLLGLTDVKAVAQYVDQVAYVVRWGKTTDEIALNGLRVLRDAQVKLMGSVLTRVNLRSHARLRYGDATQYYKRYKKYYVS